MEQLMFLFAAFLMLAALFNSNQGASLAWSTATAPNKARNWAANVYERTSLWFEKSLEDLDKTITEGISALNKQFGDFKEEQKKALEKGISKDEFDKLKSSQEKTLEKMQEQLDDLSAKSARLKENEPVKRKSLPALIEDAIISVKEAAASKSLKEWDRSRSKDVDIDLKQVKAVSDITSSYALTGDNTNIMRAFETEAGVAKDPTAPLLITDLITTATTNSQTIFWTERADLEGGAGQVAEGGAFPQVSAKFEKKSATAKKTAAYSKITEEMLEDVDYIQSEIVDEIVNGPASIRVKLENQLLTGDGTGENHKGIFTYAPSFSMPTGLETLANPNNYDVAKAGILVILKNNYMPTHMLVNPSDLMNMELTKDANGNYVIPPFVGMNGLTISGVRVAGNNRIAEGSFLIGEMRLAKLFLKRSLTLKFFDQNEDDAINDYRTITGSLRAIFRIKTPETKGFVKGTFATAKNLLKTV